MSQSLRCKLVPFSEINSKTHFCSKFYWSPISAKHDFRATKMVIDMNNTFYTGIVDSVREVLQADIVYDRALRGTAPQARMKKASA